MRALMSWARFIKELNKLIYFLSLFYHFFYLIVFKFIR